MKQVTILYLRRENQVLIAMKKRGFGAGLYNGVGGKVESGETIEQAAVRECQEEIGVAPKNIRLLGRLDFTDSDDSSIHFDTYIFDCWAWDGEPHETEEMRPEWCDQDKLPVKQMWPDDEIWLPYLVAGKLFAGSVNTSQKRLGSHTIQVVSSL